MTNQPWNILVVDDDEDILTASKLLLKRKFGDIHTTDNPAHIPELLAATSFHAILLDMNFSPGQSSGQQGLTWLAKILEIDPDAVVVMITAHSNLDIAVEAIKLGATDFVAKPWQNEKVVATLSAAVKLRASRAEAQTLKRSNQGLVAASQDSQRVLLGRSRAMTQVFSMITRCAPTDANILVLGENGTGKELVARQIHQHSLRAHAAFMAVDLGAVSESLFESELFGHRKGAFTGATDDRIGRLEAAHGGTLFLDEIGNIPLHLQAKLLTVLELREVTPVGSNKPIPFDVRVISATNISRDLLSDESHFRQDLLFRLNTVEILLPTLKDRPGDIEEIASHYAQLYSRKYKKTLKPFSPTAVEIMCAYPWPGNVRSLRHAIERAVILSQGDALEPEDLQLHYSGVAESAQVDPAQMQPTDLGDDLNLERLEIRVVQEALRQHRYNISKAAKELGITRAALYRRMEKHGI